MLCDLAYRFDTDVQDRVELYGVLAEFRDALEAEARAVRSGSGGNAVLLRQGRRIVHGAGLHHYAFQVDFPQRLPIDAPAKLVIEGRAPVDVVVAEVKGLAVTVVSPADLGQTIAGASLQTDMSFLLERLITRLEQMADKPNEIGDRVLGTLSPRAGRSDALVSSRYTLLPEQEAALRQALGGDVFIWGPPGTGKTQTIGSIVSELLRAGRSVLLVSHTNSAVDGGLERAIRNLRMLADDGPGFEEGDLVRVGTCKDRRLQDDSDASRPSVLETSRPLGTKRGRGRGSFVADTRAQTIDFYRDLVQQLTAWRPRAPQLPTAPAESPVEEEGLPEPIATSTPPEFMDADRRDPGEAVEPAV